MAGRRKKHQLCAGISSSSSTTNNTRLYYLSSAIKQNRAADRGGRFNKCRHSSKHYSLGAITGDYKVTNSLDIFRQEFLGANTWAQRKDGVPLDLLDNLSAEELKIAEEELIKAASLHDDWPILGLGYIKSKEALPTLIELLNDSKGVMKIKIAHAIFQISQDDKMKDIVIDTFPKIKGELELIDALYYLPFFKDKRITDLLHEYRTHEKYLVAYNATRYLGLSTNEVVEKFGRKDKPASFWRRLFG
jgi:hypothetical protein